MSQATTVDLKKLKRQLSKIDKQRDQEKINKERISKGLRPILSTEDIRDNTISILKNSGVSDELVHARNGPTPLTLARWRAKKVLSPRMSSIRSALRAVGKDIGIIDL